MRGGAGLKKKKPGEPARGLSFGLSTANSINLPRY